MEKLVLLGTVHRDPAGKARLLGALAEFRPTVISLEVSPSSVALRRQYGRRWSRLFRERLADLSRRMRQSPGSLMAGSNLRGLFEYLRLPYEYRASLHYARTYGCPLFLLDDSKLAANFLNRVELEILSRKNMALLAQTDQGWSLHQEVDNDYIRAGSRIFDEEVWSGSWLDHREDLLEREAGLSQRLRLLHQGLKRRSGRKLSGRELSAGLIISADALGFIPESADFSRGIIHVYVGGWEHLVEDEDGTTLYTRLKDLVTERRLCLEGGPV